SPKSQRDDAAPGSLPQDRNPPRSRSSPTPRTLLPGVARRDRLRRLRALRLRVEAGWAIDEDDGAGSASDPTAKAGGFTTHPCGWRLVEPAYTIPLSAQAWPCGQVALVAMSRWLLEECLYATSLCVQSAFSSRASPGQPGIPLPRPIPTVSSYRSWT